MLGKFRRRYQERLPEKLVLKLSLKEQLGLASMVQWLSVDL